MAQPELKVFYPVSGIDQLRFNYVQTSLAEAGVGQLAELTTLFWPVSELRASLIADSEVQKLFKLADRPANGANLKRLSRYIDQDLSEFAESHDPIDTFPIKLERPFDGVKTRALTISPSLQLYKERIITQKTICNFLGLAAVPQGIWLRSPYVAGVRLAQGFEPRHTKMLNAAKHILNQKEELRWLPKAVRLGELTVKLV